MCGWPVTWQCLYLQLRESIRDSSYTQYALNHLHFFVFAYIGFMYVLQQTEAQKKKDASQI